MSGKPRRKKGETVQQYTQRVKDWEKGQGEIATPKATKDVAAPDPMPTHNKPACHGCKYYVKGFQARRGDCFRFPKIMQVSELHWCGEFKIK